MARFIQDERYTVSDDAIYDAFFELLKTKSIDKITVADVVKRAGVVRSTFYKHYENIPALVKTIEERTLYDVFSLLQQFHPKNNHEICYSFYLTIRRYAMENPYFAELVQHPQNEAFFSEAIKMLHKYVRETMEHTNPVQHSKEEVSYVISCAIGSTIGVLHKWTREGCHVPAETIADIMTQVFMAGMLPLLS